MKKTSYLLIAIIVFVVLFASACGGAPTAPQPSGDQTPAAAPAVPPAVKDTEPTNTYCVEKIPYQNISVDPGTTFETLDPKGELKCQDSGTVVGGKTVLTCTGKQLWTYDLKLTSSSGGSKTIKVNMGACPLPK
jgi:hypothetical protein